MPAILANRGEAVNRRVYSIGLSMFTQAAGVWTFPTLFWPFFVGNFVGNFVGHFVGNFVAACSIRVSILDKVSDKVSDKDVQSAML